MLFSLNQILMLDAPNPHKFACLVSCEHKRSVRQKRQGEVNLIWKVLEHGYWITDYFI